MSLSGKNIGADPPAGGEPLMRSREVATFSQKPRSMKRGDEYNGNLFTGYTAGVLQRAGTIFRLSYGT